MTFSDDLDGLLERRGHHARSINPDVIKLAYGALLGVAEKVRTRGVTHWFYINGRSFRASRKGDILEVYSPACHGEQIGAISLTTTNLSVTTREIRILSATIRSTAN